MMTSLDEIYRRWVDAVDYSNRAELEALAANPDELAESFSRNLKFGTGGLRAKLGIGPNRLNVWTVGKATQGLADYLNGRFDEPAVAIARDSRRGGGELARRTAEVLAANGVRSVILERPEPTPALSFAVRDLGCSAGVVITASHNPAEYNGYKVYGADGCQITTEAAREIQRAIDAVDVFDGVRRASFEEAVSAGTVSWAGEDVLDRYVGAVLAQARGVDCSGLSVAYTPLNGAGLECAERVLRGIGVGALHVVDSQASPDGDFPTCPKPNPEVPQAMEAVIELASREGCDLALATDPDADRTGVAVRHGGGYVTLSGNQVGVLLLDWAARHAREAGEDLSRKVAVTTVVTAPMADDVARLRGFELRRTLTGFKFAGEQVGLLESEGREADFLLGIEESLGYLSGTYVRDKDGVEACMLVCEMAADYGREGLDLVGAFERLCGECGHWHSRQLTRQFEGADGPERMAALMRGLRKAAPEEVAGLGVERAIDYGPGAEMPVVNPGAGYAAQRLPGSDVLEWRLAGGSRVLMRPSGTEPKLKAYVFARASDGDEAEMLCGRLCAAVEGLMGE